MPIIDFHIHVTTVDEYRPWFLGWARHVLGDDAEEQLRRVLDTPQGLLAFMDAQDIAYAVCLAEQNVLTTGLAANDRVADFCRASERLIFFASVNPFLTTDLAGELTRCVEKLDCRGLKLYPTYQHFYPNDRRLYPLYDCARRLGVPVMFHTGSSAFYGSRLKYGDPLYLDDVAADFPGLTLIMSHGGRGFWYGAALTLARLHPNVWLDVTGLPPHKLLDYFPDLPKVADRVVFGSDWPAIADVRANAEAVRALPLPPGLAEAILYGNAARLLGLAGQKR